MFATVMYGPRDVRFEQVEDPRSSSRRTPSSNCRPHASAGPISGLIAVCSRRLSRPIWDTNIAASSSKSAARSKTVRPGQFVVGSFCLSDNTCPHCKFGFQSSCVQREFMRGAQAPYARVPLADGTLVATADMPGDDLVPHLLATSDVLGTGWYAADAANVRPGSAVAVVGDGAVGLMGVLAAKEMCAERIIAMSRHKSRQALAREFGATDVVAERGAAGIERVKELTGGVGVDSVLECVGAQESMTQAINSVRPGGSIGYVGVPHGVTFDGQAMFFSQRRMMGGPAPVRRFLPDLMDRVLTGRIKPGKVFDLTLPIAEVAEGYRAMDERRAIKTMLKV
jgi:threonine dehydrogenase-like Zn-dependent dehydrogenase